MRQSRAGVFWWAVFVECMACFIICGDCGESGGRRRGELWELRQKGAKGVGGGATRS